MSQEITITLTQLQILLDQQKELVIEALLGNSSYYNEDSTDGVSISMKINEDRFKQAGNRVGYPYDFKVLSKYIK